MVNIVFIITQFTTNVMKRGLCMPGGPRAIDEKF